MRSLPSLMLIFYSLALLQRSTLTPMGRIARGTRLFAICMTAASSALVWLPAAVASAAPAATSATARGAASSNSAAGTHDAVTPASDQARSATAVAQAAAQAGSISGTVVGPAAVPLAGICVTATGPSGRLLARTNGDGQYTLAGLKAGRYTVGYADCTSPDSYAARAYPGGSVHVAGGQRASLEPVTLTATSPMQAIATEQAYAQAHESAAPSAANAATTVKYAVTGTVSDKAGKPLAGICVTATGEIKLGGDFVFSVFAKTNKDGRYAIPALPSGFHVVSWQLLFTVGCGNGGNYAPQWWRGAASAAKATALPASTHEITGIDATLTQGGSIAGVIRGKSASGPGLKGACVQAFGIGGQGGVSILAHSGAGGRYVLRGLGTGSYDVAFLACSAGNYLNGSYRKVTARVGTTRTLNAFLVAGATVAGTVTSSLAGHAVLAKICVVVSGSGLGIFLPETETETTKSGHYSIDQLPHGTYYVTFFGGCGNSGSYAPQYYQAGARTGSLSAATATAIKLGVGAKYTASVAMLPGGTLAGTVTAQPSGGPVKDVCVEPITEPEFGGLPSVPFVIAEPFGQAITNAAGRYTVNNLQPGLYILEVADCFNYKYSGTWFDPEGNNSPQLISVTSGAVVRADASLSPAGSITGTVTDHAGHGLKDICMEAIRQGTVASQMIPFYGPRNAVSGKTGKFEFEGLPPGSYSVGFAACGGHYAAQWYKDKAPGSPGTAVQVRAGRTTSNINATLTSGKSVSVVVVSGVTGKPVPGCLMVSSGPLSLLPTVSTSRSGRFTVKHLAAGTYQAEAYSCGHGAALLAQLQTEIRIPAGHSTTTIVLRLPRRGSIAGTVTAPGTPGGATYACVYVTSDSGEFSATATVNRSGQYSLTNVAPGSYQVLIDDGCSGGKTLAPQAFSVHVAAGATTTLNAVLVANGSITGSVTGSASSAPVAGICVAAYASTTATEPAAVAITVGNGSYQISFLPPGTYLVKFSSGCGASGYATQWYKDASSATTATAVSVSPGAAVSGVNAAMSS